MLNNLHNLNDEGILFIISGPAGSGKTTLCNQLIETVGDRIARVITATTRKPRNGEIHASDFYFLSHDQFAHATQNNLFYEYAKVHTNYYGTFKSEIDSKLKQNQDILLNVDIQGASTFRKFSTPSGPLHNKLVTIFVMPPSITELEARLNNRGLDSPEDIVLRLQVAEQEIKHWQEFDYCIPSSSKENDFACLLSIYAAEKLKIRKKLPL